MARATARFFDALKATGGNDTCRRHCCCTHRRPRPSGAEARGVCSLRSRRDRCMDASRPTRGPAMKVAEVAIESIAAGGDGVGRSDGIVIFIPRTAPGDRVRAKLDVRKRFARGTIDAVLEPSPDRIEPPCVHYRIDRCGGCQLQHIRYHAQLDAKRSIVHDALTRIARRTVDRPTVEASAAQWRYRRKLTLAMRRRRGGDWVIGLHPYDDPVGVFALEDCPITDDRVMSVWHEVIAARAYFPREDELR